MVSVKFILVLANLIPAIVTGTNLITFPKPSEHELTSQSEAELTPRPQEQGSAESLGYHVANLGLKTLRDLLPNHGNVIVSPFNIYTCLGILNLGAEGTTKSEIMHVLGPRNVDLSTVDLAKAADGVSYASALFLDRHFQPTAEFTNSAARRFEASVLNVNMSDGEAARLYINSWVSDHTNGTITNLLQGSVDPQTRLVVVSALLFNGKWLQSFSPAATTVGKFHVDESTTVDVHLMHLLATVSVVRNPLLDAIGLPYQGRGMKMYLILPKSHGLPALKRLLSHLNVNSLRKLKSESVNDEVLVIIPKLKIDGQYSLGKTLRQQGISSMFNATKARFGPLAGEDSHLHVTDIYHSVHFEMNEEGTTASAATASILTKSSKFVFRAIRPFIMVITNSEDLILFMGAVVRP